MADDDLRHEYDIAMEFCKEGSYQEALDLLELLAKERPDSKHVLYGRGLCLVGLGRLDEARLMRDRLAMHHGNSARKFIREIDDEIKVRQRSKDRALIKGPGQISSHTTSGESYTAPSRWGLKVAVFLIVLVAVVAAVGVVVVMQQSAHDRNPGGTDIPPLLAGSGPDRYLEAPLFFPAGMDKSYRFAVFLAPPEGEVSNALTDVKDDCTGTSVVNDWSGVKTLAKKALMMAGSGEEPVQGVPRDTLVCTVVLPRAGLPMTGPLEGQDLRTFTPSSVRDLKGLVNACGQPDHRELWMQQGRYLGLNGNTEWWGRVGFAADETGQISHLLIRAYPGDKR